MSREPKKRLQRAIDKGPEWSCAIRQIMMPRHTNMYETVFGGIILSLIDQAALVEVRMHGLHKWVTASFERVDFKSPVRIGDVISLYTRTSKEGNKSIQVDVCVEVNRYDTNKIETVTTAHVTMVSVDKNGIPIPFAEPATLGS